jgi:hypothetical protein
MILKPISLSHSNKGHQVEFINAPPKIVSKNKNIRDLYRGINEFERG